MIPGYTPTQNTWFMMKSVFSSEPTTRCLMSWYAGLRSHLYQVKPIALRQQVRRNPKRFPADFLFELDEEETEVLLSQNVIPSRRSLGGSRPLAFTEQGISMLSSVLTSDRAIEVNIAIMRAFVRLRKLLATHEDLARRLDQLEWRQNEQGQQIQTVFETLQHLIEAPEEGTRRRIGFPTSRAEHGPDLPRKAGED